MILYFSHAGESAFFSKLTVGSNDNKITLKKGDLVRLAIHPRDLGRVRMKLNNLIMRLRMKGISGKSLSLVFKCILRSRLCVLRIRAILGSRVNEIIPN